MLVLQPNAAGDFICFRENDIDAKRAILSNAYRLKEESLFVGLTIVLANPNLIILNYRDDLDIGENWKNISGSSYNDVMNELTKVKNELFIVEHIAVDGSWNYSKKVSMNLCPVAHSSPVLKPLITKFIRTETIDEILKNI